MKPLHIGLLVVGAALAGGLAVKMTQPTALPSTAPVSKVLPTQQTTSAPVVNAPPAVEAQPTPSQNTAPAARPDVKAANAPPPVYTEPAPEPKAAAVKPSPTRWKPSKEAAPKAAPKPVVVARNIVPAAPPPPYQPPAVVDPGPAAATSPVEQPRTPDPEPEPSAPPMMAPRKVTLNMGSTIPARLIQTLSSDKLRAGDTFQATLADPLIVGDLVIAERGARVTGRVVDAGMAGRFQGTSKLELALTSFESADGQRVAISTNPWVKQGESGRNGEVAKIGGGAALGAIIGAIAGGGKGAAIGAGVGGGAGTGAVAMTPPKPVRVETETVIRFRLASPVTITERI